MNLGSSLGKLSDATLVPRNPYYVERATENVEAFIEESEKAFVLGDAPYASEDPPYDKSWKFADDTAKSKQFYLEKVEETVNLLLSARDSSANDKALRDALNARYEGKAKDVTPYRNLFEGLRRENILGSAVRFFADPVQGGHKANLVMILMFLGIKADSEMVESLEKGVETMKSFEVPFPLQSCDYSIIIRTTMGEEKIMSIVDAVKAITSSEPGEGPKIDKEVLKKFLSDVEKGVGDREYQTVGDKIAVGIFYSIISRIYDIDKDFREDKDYWDTETNKPDYTRFFEYVFAKEKGKASMDKILSYFDALSYIYNSKLDIAGLVSGAF
ncbi:MAG: hypothetical protein J6W39_08925 [Spirochaetales bacterium]|nr:hypothetical protein [Spirochaetales bacterium]